VSYDDSLETIYDPSKSSIISEHCRVATVTYGYQQSVRKQSDNFCYGCSEKSLRVGPLD
jgi:hypothetical protein